MKMEIYHEIWNVVYPRCCIVCDEILENQKRWACPACEKRIKVIKQPYCFQCGRRIFSSESEYCGECRKQEHVYDRGFSLVEYDAATAPSILGIKYKNRREYVEFYGQLAQERYDHLLKKYHIMCIVPVPMNQKKQRKRGFNQAELFANEIAKWLYVPVKSDYIIRNKKTAPLKELGPLQRRKELEKAFIPNDKLEKYPEHTALLVDDIYTTGATVNACAKVLKDKGIKKVYVLTMAIGRGNN